MRFKILVIFYLISPAPTRVAAFDCSRAATIIEEFICCHPVLAKYDNDLSSLYKKLLYEVKSNSDRATIKEEQAYWLKVIRNIVKKDTLITLQQCYQKRMNDLRLKKVMINAQQPIPGCYVKISQVAPMSLSALTENGEPGYDTVVNSITIGQISDSVCPVTISITSGNGRTCELSGTARKTGDHDYRIVDNQENGECEALITIENGTIHIEQKSGCNGAPWCGDGASLDESFRMVSITKTGL